MTTQSPRVLSFLLCQALALGQGLVVSQPTQPTIHGPIAPSVTSGLLQVRIEVRDGAATTLLTQTIKNASLAQQEAHWLLPLPPGATADKFTLTVGGRAMPGEVLDASQARGIYEEIVRKRRDPGLLEYLGNGCLRARVFPIPPQGEVQVAVRFSQLLRSGDGVTTVGFPARSAWLDGIGPERLSFVVDVQSGPAIKTAWSPQQELQIARDGEHRLLASAEYGRGAMPARDLQLHFGLSDQDFGLSLLTYRRPGQPGYFVAWLAPKRDWPKDETTRRCVHLVLDTSGSMAGEKIVQARAAVRAFVQSLSEHDWFNVVPFSTDARPFFPRPVPADQAHRAQALLQVDQIEARGGTNIGDALQFTLQQPLPEVAAGQTVVPITVFVTDGLPTVGTTDVDLLLQQALAQNGGRSRVFSFGVGHDVNTRLLDTLAIESRGDRDYVQPGEDIERKTSVLFSKLSGPVMTGLALRVEGMPLEDVEPRALPDLFVAGQIAVVGRYRGEGPKAIRLRGAVGGAVREYAFDALFPATTTQHDWLPTLWAQHRVAALLDAIRVHGQNPELVAEVTRLGKEFAIVTPFTSHLVVEEGMRLATAMGFSPGLLVPTDPEAQERLRTEWIRAGLEAPATAAPMPDLPALQDEAKKAREALAAPADTGAVAVAQSVALLALSQGRFARGDGATARLHRRVADRTFHLANGVWIDGAFEEPMRSALRRVPAFSEDWFALLREQPELQPYFAFSARVVIVTAAGQAIEVVD